jgi:mannose-6-phosphate isomerase-like protein (cupin superfamily)
MHIKQPDLQPTALSAGETALVYPTAEGQDCQSLERFMIRTLAPNAKTATDVDEERESFWMVIRGGGTVTRGGASAALGEKDLLIFGEGEPHSFEAGPDGLEFFDVAWTSKVLSVPEIKAALKSVAGVGEPYGANSPQNGDGFNNSHIMGSSMPPQEGDTCFRYAHDRGHCSLDHWDQNSTLPTWRAADHSHIANEEFWYIVDGVGHVEHGGAPGIKGEPFPVGPGSLIGHPVGVHHTLVASDPDKPIKWYCIALNTHLTDPEKPYLAMLDPALAKTISEATHADSVAATNARL